MRKKVQNKDIFMRLEGLSSGVTGSCNYCKMHGSGKTIEESVIDCGSFLNEEAIEDYNKTFPFVAKRIKWAVATHFHVDHVGRFMLLYGKGYKGKVYGSKYTTSKLKESAIKNYHEIAKNGEYEIAEEDAIKLIQNAEGVMYNEPFKVGEYTEIVFFKNAHRKGALMAMMCYSYEGEEINVLFTGDYKESIAGYRSEIPEEYRHKPVTIVTEATYGSKTEPKKILCKDVKEAIEEKKEVVIFCMGMEKVEYVLNSIRLMKKEGELEDNIPIYIEIGKNFEMNSHIVLSLPSNVSFIRKADEKRQAMYDKNQKIIIVTSRGGQAFFLPKIADKTNAFILFTNFHSLNSAIGKLINMKKGEEFEYCGQKICKRATIKDTQEFEGHSYARDFARLINTFDIVNGVILGHGVKRMNK